MAGDRAPDSMPRHRPGGPRRRRSRLTVQCGAGPAVATPLALSRLLVAASCGREIVSAVEAGPDTPPKGCIPESTAVFLYKGCVSERYHWDGTAKEPGTSGFASTRTMWLHRSNGTTTLRRDALTRCRYCGLLMEYFDRYDHRRIPMVPKPVPSAAVPAQMRWHVMGGVAFPGDGGHGMCHVPHPAFCPMVEHEDDNLSLAQARAVFRKKSDERTRPRSGCCRCAAARWPAGCGRAGVQVASLAGQCRT
ncbi:DUF6083 domain-containing protein [Streptomyces sp. NPDC046909]|uniref:DUF6083 domain-containing protein n=1 Tax=Streptomyces sp. NPDC046909 TaxID=3155617 RepID=UPI0033C10896